MAEFPLLVPKFDDLENESLFKSRWWIFMWKYVNITVYIWSQNLAMCLITKIGGCIRLIRAASPRGQWVNDAPCTVKLWGMDIGFTPSVCFSVPYTVSALWLVAYFMDYIQIWHKYKPWVDDVSHTISRSAGLGRVPDLRVQVRVLVICVSTSPSPSTWLLHEYESEYEYWLMSTSTSTSTGLWSTFYIACIGSRFLLFGLWQESPQILTNLGQSSNCPLSL